MKKVDYDKLNVNQRQLELYSKHYALDEENKIIEVTLHYEKVSDVLDYSIGNPDAPLYKQETFDTILDKLDNCPPTYKVELNFEVEDFEQVEPKYLIESFNDSLEMGQYKTKRETLKRDVLAATLVLAGILILFFQIIGKAKGWFGPSGEIQESIVSEVIDISAWVFIWEAVTLFFLEHSDTGRLAVLIRKKVNKIKISKKENGEELVSEDFEQIYKKWVKDEFAGKLAKYCMLISSFVFLFLAFWDLYMLSNILNNPEIRNANKLASTILTIISSILTVCAGVGGVYNFLGKYGKITRFVGPYAIALLVVIILNLISVIIMGQANSIASYSLSLVISIFYIFGYLMDKHYRNKKN